MALRFFDKVVDEIDTMFRETKITITITFTYNGVRSSEQGSITSYNVEGFDAFYKYINGVYTRDLKYLEGRIDNFKGRKEDIEPSVRIIISGKINNNPLNLIFNDLNSFHDYLEKNNLIPKSAHELKPGK